MPKPILNNEMVNIEFDETLDLLEEWFLMHKKMDFAHRTKEVKKEWNALKLAIQKGSCFNEEERAETHRIRLCISELIKLVRYSDKKY